MNTFKNIHFGFILAVFYFLPLYLAAQTPEQAANWEFDYTVTGNHIYEARDYIKLKPGFSYTPTANPSKSLDLKINDELIFNADYIDPNDPSYIDPDTRELDLSLPVGSIAGQGGVTQTGAANYSIPINIPPGTAGMEPKIAINYSSQSGMGLLGVGWNINAISSVSRISKTYFNSDNNIVDGINLDINDKFALDGNRLVLLPGSTGTYGTDGSVYATENETFSQITAHGAIGNGPEWIEVKTKDGKTLEYGRTSDSRLIPTGNSNTTVLTWNLNKISDAFGNYILYNYNETLDGESVISSIEYTGNSDAGLTPYNKIRFLYEDKMRHDTYYVGGAHINQTVILRTIKVECEGTQIREYDFSYSNDLYPHLYEITEYDKNNHLNSTLIKWGDIGDQFTSQSQTFVQPDYGYTTFKKCLKGDINGDGRADICYFWQDPTNDHIRIDVNFSHFDVLTHDLSLNAESSIEMNLAGESYIFVNAYVFDINNDGFDEIYVEYKKPNDQNRYFSCINGTQSPVLTFDANYSRTINNSGYDVCVQAGDYTGNGTTDVLFYDAATGVAIDAIGDVSVSIVPNYQILGFMEQPIDFNGDGKSELLCYDLSGGYIRVYTLNTSVNPYHFDQINSAMFSCNYEPTGKLFLGDFNGDGKTDMLMYNAGWHIYLSTGTLFALQNDWSCYSFQNEDPSATEDNYNYFIDDFNGDGKSDVFEVYKDINNNNLIHGTIFYSVGDNFMTPAEGFTNPNSSYTINNGSFATGDINGDNKSDIFWITDATGLNTKLVFPHKDGQSNLVQTIYDGLNNFTKFNYSTLSKYDVYTKGTSSTFPMNDMQAPIYVVKSMETPDPGTANFITSYSYNGLIIHRQGLGSLGFTGFTQSNVLGKDIFTFSYNNQLPYYCNVYLWKKGNQNAGGDPVSTTTYTNDVYNFGSHRIFPYTSNEETQNYVTGIHTKTDYSYTASEGNITQIETLIKDGTTLLAKKLEQYSNYISAGNWGINNKYQNKSVTSGRYIGSTSSIYRNYIYTWDSNTGTLLSEKDNDYNVLTTYIPDPDFGVVTQVEVSAADIDTRTVLYQYDSKKRFITRTINALGHIVENNYDSKYGNVTWNKDENNLITTYKYDNFGRLNETTLPTGKKVTSSISWSSGQVPDNTLYFTKIEGNGKPFVMEYKDMLGRTLRKQTEGWNTPTSSILIYSDNLYNSKGQLWKISYLDPAGTVEWTENTYDDYDRITSISSPVVTKTYTYTTPTSSGTSVTETNTSVNPNQSKTTSTDLTGLTSSVTDLGGTISYTYNGLNQPKTITGNGLTTTITYDAYGRQMYLTDPNAGQTHYEYYSNGELKKQTNAKGNVYEMAYDKLGRLKTKTCTTDGTYTYTYDTEAHGKGKVASIAHTNGTSQQFKYDQYGRNYRFTDVIPGQSDFVTNYSFDDYGNVTQIVYPGGFTVNRTFDNIGNLTEVKQASNNKSIWKLDAMDYMMNITQYKTANNTITNNKYFDADNGNLNEIKTGNLFDYSFSFDAATGNLLQRKDKNRNLTENFTFDDLNRLEEAAISGGATLTTAFLANGNIDYKSDVLAANSHYAYSSTQPNALVKIVNSIGNISSLSQTTDYNSFNKISHIGEETSTYDMNFTYGVDQERKKVETKANNSLTSTKYYTANFEREVNAVTENIKEWNYIAGGDGLAAIYINNNGNGALHWALKDHLGSVMGLYNESGTMEEEYSYDAWGRRRNPTNWSYSITQPTLITRGYTGHEHLDAFALINMNGRLYDPVLGRMLSPDNFVQDATGTQSFNRYSYALNNPLIYTDPNGEFIFSLFLGPVGVMLDAACWSALIDAGMQGIKMANGSQEKFNWSELGGAAAGGFISGGMGLLAPSFAGSSLASEYLGKAAWVGLTGASSAAGGLFAQDLFNNGKVDFSGSRYLNAASWGFGMGAGISLASSLYQYESWDKYTNQERFDIIKNKYENINMEYDKNLLADAQWDENNKIMKIGNSGLSENKGWAKSAILHELQHRADYITQNLPANASIYDKWGATDYNNWLDTRAYASELRHSINNTYNPNQWYRMVVQFNKYNGLIGNANTYNPRTYFLLLILNKF
jgi:RHS repeat-associated protein